jgi:adenine-specific DNA-methyltransferase
MENEKSRKLRGGYYTPQQISEFIVNWAIQKQNDIVLEPSCGDGAFIDTIILRYLSLGVTKKDISSLIHAVEYNKVEAEKAETRFKTNGIKPARRQLLVGDFFKYCKSYLSEKIQFDCIVGNPPFIRYQDFPDDQRSPAFSLMIKAGLNPNKLTNAWIPFLIASTLLLKSSGRIGMVVPAELFQVNYAAQTRRFLSESFSKLFIVTFRKLVFPDVQQEVVLLLGEKNGHEKHGISVVEVDDVNSLSSVDVAKFKTKIKTLDHSSDKWTQYFLDNSEIELLRRLKSDTTIPLSGEFADVDVGVVTGQNKFFVLSQEEVSKFKLEKYVGRIIGRANHAKGLVISDDDWNCLARSQAPVYLLNAPNVNYDSLPSEIKQYVDYGILQGVDSGYKCSKRKNWWFVPSVWVPDAFMLRQVHGFPKIILNKCNATTTDTLHRVKLINGMTGEILAAAFVNSLTLAFSEVTGRSYGGGVLTFEPSEAERLPLPVNNAGSLDVRKIDRNLRENNIENILDITDDILLRKGLKLTKTDITMLRGIWRKLRDRRIQRRSLSQNNNQPLSLLSKRKAV